MKHTDLEEIETTVNASDINAQDSKGYTKLHKAINNTDMAEVQSLLATPGIDVNLQTQTGDSPLHLAVIYMPEAIPLLLAKGANPNLRNVCDYTSLHEAVVEGSITAVMHLLAAPGIDLDVQDDRGFTPLHCAITHEKVAIAGLLIAAGADVNTTNIHHNTPLHSSVHVCPEAVELLLASKKALINALNEGGDTALHLAARSGNIDATHMLLNTPGIKVHIVNNQGVSAYTSIWQNEVFYIHINLTYGNANHIPFSNQQEYVERLEDTAKALFKQSVGLKQDLSALEIPHITTVFIMNLARHIRRFSILAAMRDLFMPLVKARNEKAAYKHLARTSPHHASAAALRVALEELYGEDSANQKHLASRLRKHLRRFAIVAATRDMFTPKKSLQRFFNNATPELLRSVLETFYGPDDEDDKYEVDVPDRNNPGAFVKEKKSLTSAYFNHLSRTMIKYEPAKKPIQDQTPTHTKQRNIAH